MSCDTTKRTFDERFAMELYNAGKNDKEIAECCRVKAKTIAEWRKGQGLEANTPMRAQRKIREKASPLVKDAIEARKLGLTYGQYKSQFCRPMKFLRGWRN